MNYLRHIMVILVTANLGLSLYLLDRDILDPLFYSITLAAVILLASVTLCSASRRTGRQRMLLGSALYSVLMVAGALIGQTRETTSLLILAMLLLSGGGGYVCYRLYRRLKAPKRDLWSAYFH